MVVVVGPSFRVAGRRQGSDRKIPSFRNYVSPMGNPDVGRPHVEDRLNPELEQACFLLLKTEASFLGGFVVNVDNHNVFAVAVPQHVGRQRS